MKPLRSLWHGVDTAKVGYVVAWPTSFTKELAEFRRLRELAQSIRPELGSITHSLGSYPQPFQVRPQGARMLPFALEAMGFIMFIGDTQLPWMHGNICTPNVRFEFQPYAVAREGFARLHAEALKIIDGMKGYVVTNLLSEVHMTNDIQTGRPHRPSDYHTDIDGLWRNVRTLIRSNGQVDEIEAHDCRIDTAGRRLKQINIGKDKKMLRVYDKLLELRTHPDKLFEALLWDTGGDEDFLGKMIGPEPTTAVMRVEFQLRRERLIQLQISTVEDFLAKQGGLWQHLTEEFIVMIENDDSNRSRCSTQEWWKLVQKAWQDHPPCELRKRPKAKPDFKKYVDQTMGLMLAMGARINADENLNLQDITDVMTTVWETGHPDDWKALMQKKREKFAILWADLPQTGGAE